MCGINTSDLLESKISCKEMVGCNHDKSLDQPKFWLMILWSDLVTTFWLWVGNFTIHLVALTVNFNCCCTWVLKVYIWSLIVWQLSPCVVVSTYALWMIPLCHISRSALHLVPAWCLGRCLTLANFFWWVTEWLVVGNWYIMTFTLVYIFDSYSAHISLTDEANFKWVSAHVWFSIQYIQHVQAF